MGTKDTMLIDLSSIDPSRRFTSIGNAARIAAVEDLQLFEQRYIDEFGRVADVVARTLHAPISLVSLIEKDRQFVVGRSGVPDEVTELPLSHTFCNHVVKGGAPVIVGDGREDPVFKDNIGVTEYGVVAYAGMPVSIGDGEMVGAVCAVDMEPRKWTEDELAVLGELAQTTSTILELRSELIRRELTDSLTGLPNRRLLIAACSDMLDRIGEEKKVAVLCAGVDHFNMVNQAFGTDRADQILKAVGDRLKEAARDTDVFGRLRGDVFTMVAPEIDSPFEFLDLASDLRAALDTPLNVDGEPLSLQVTVGISQGEAGSQGSDLISEAANAMREAKQRKGRIHVAERGWKETASAHLRMREALHGALDRGEISAAFQPIVELESGRILSFEALARWENDALGKIPPDEFIPLAEVTADIIPIGEWIIGEAAALAAQALHETGRDIRVTVNVSPLQISQLEFPRMVANILDEYGLEGKHLGFEITEGLLLEAEGLQEDNLRALSMMDSRILLDDFGTGYSSLAYLRDLPVDYVKIDRLFIASMEEDRHSTALIQAILSMARSMELGIVAEGIETEDQAKFLRLLGCRLGQGYLLGRPASREAALGLVGSDV